MITEENDFIQNGQFSTENEVTSANENGFIENDLFYTEIEVPSAITNDSFTYKDKKHEVHFDKNSFI